MEPVEGSPELRSADRIEVLIEHLDSSLEPEVGDIIEIVHSTLLFIIPGIIASYSYAMTEYILADHPELSATEAISRSKQMMGGNKWRLFCLQFSFIGWSILCSFTFGIGNLWMTPYKQAATAVFYREVSGTEHSAYQNE